ncbi:helix-turn-helix domain-containing protein [Microbacterium marinilacus]|uniref:Helix-turn-helix transcriptional regulator n=1 Tax=Microbacterium marinilacus TaxID=415209 RepID=A0ABP7BHT9_9MICO|nr:AraC family transcriptional regulator [Microbacterium marinilacus]MBY0690154.1 AraC family transcriptional regulator [Microbacterium marinilacus]
MTPGTNDGLGLGAWRREPKTLTLRAVDVPDDAPTPFVIFAESDVTSVPLEWEPHAHPMHELVWVRGGTLTARVDDRIFTVPEGRGLWHPAGTVHAGRLTAGVELHDAFFAPERTPFTSADSAVIEMTPVLESLLGHLARRDLDDDARARAEAVVFDVLRPADASLALPMPADDRIDAIVAELLDDPADSRSLEEWSHVVGISGRTVARAFREATGLSFAQWRQSLRIHRAVSLLSEGWEVQDVAAQVGYRQPSTFIDAFRRVMGTTPGAFVALMAGTHSGV